MTIQLEVGKTYLNRRGEKVTIISNDGHKTFPFNCTNSCYTPDGKYYIFSGDDKDLVAEYAELVIQTA